MKMKRKIIEIREFFGTNNQRQIQFIPSHPQHSKRSHGLVTTHWVHNILVNWEPSDPQ